MSSATRNGTTRKSLADQIDRLDRTLDGLTENLNDAVSAAVQKAVQQTVESLVTEVLTNPEIAHLFRGMATPPHPEPARPGGRPGFFARVWSKTKRAVQAACAGIAIGVVYLVSEGNSLARKAWSGCRSVAGMVGSGLTWLWGRIKILAWGTGSLVSRPVLAAWSVVKNAISSMQTLTPWSA